MIEGSIDEHLARIGRGEAGGEQGSGGSSMCVNVSHVNDWQLFLYHWALKWAGTVRPDEVEADRRRVPVSSVSSRKDVLPDS